MKKSLSLIVAIAMIVSLFSSVAFAADKTAADKFNELKAAGIFTGTGSGDGMELSKEMDRASAAVIVARLSGLTTEASTTKVFDDVDPASAPAPYIAAAVKAGILHGDGNGKYRPYDNVQQQELAVMLVEAYAYKTGEKVDTTATADVDASAYALPYIKAALDLKLFGDVSDWTGDAIREDLVNSTYATNDAIVAKANAATAADISSFSAVGAKKLEVKFNKAVDDTKATIAIKKGNFAVATSKTTWSDDKTTATVEIASKLTKGDYSVSVTGLTDAALTKTVSVEDEKVAKIEFVSDKAPLGDDNQHISAFVKVSNQYGEDAYNILNPSISSSKGTPTTPDSSGKIGISVTGTANYTLDEKVVVTVLDKTSGAFASGTLTVSPKAAVSTVNVVKLYNADDKDLKTDSTPGDFYFVVEGKDQYGNSVTSAQLRSDTIVNVVNNTLADADETAFTDLVIDGDSKIVLPLQNGTGGDLKAGTTQLVILSKTTGNRATFDFTIGETAKLDSLTLSAPELAVAGETVTIPFEAMDQFGNAVTDVAKLNAGISSKSVTGLSGVDEDNLTFVKNLDTGKAELHLDLSGATNTDATTVYVNMVNASYKSANLSLTVQPAKKPVAVTGVEDVNTALAIDATTAIKHDKVQVVDQYGRSKHLSDFAGYEVHFDAGTTAAIAATDDTSIDSASDTNLVAKTKGNATIKLTLYKSGSPATEVKDSSYNLSVKVVDRDAIKSYEVADVDTLYAGGSDYAKDLKVEGVLDNGSKVTLPTPSNTTQNYYSVTESVYGLAYDGSTGKLTADAPAAAAATADIDNIDDGKDGTFAVVIVGTTKDGAQQIAKQVKVSRVAPTATSLAVYTNGDVTKENDGTVSIAVSDVRALSATQLAQMAVQVKDQYGVVMSSGISAGFATKTLASVNAGDSFDLTAVATNGEAKTFKVEVKADPTP